MFTELTSSMMSSFAPVIPYFIMLGLIGLFVRLLQTPTVKGWIGERIVEYVLRHRLDPTQYRRIPNVMLPTPDGTTQIDHIIVSRYGIFVIETKNYRGWIYGREKDALWTQVIYRRKERFQNPLRQNYKHVKVLSELTGIPAGLFKSVIVFLGQSTFKTQMPDNVIHISGMVRYIKSTVDTVIKPEQVDEIVQAIGQWASTVDRESRRNHVRNLSRNRQPIPVSAAPPACPRCGAAMQQRRRRNDGQAFWGCSEYPQCRGIRNAQE